MPSNKVKKPYFSIGIAIKNGPKANTHAHTLIYDILKTEMGYTVNITLPF